MLLRSSIKDSPLYSERLKNKLPIVYFAESSDEFIMTKWVQIQKMHAAAHGLLCYPPMLLTLDLSNALPLILSSGRSDFQLMGYSEVAERQGMLSVPARIRVPICMASKGGVISLLLGAPVAS